MVKLTDAEINKIALDNPLALQEIMISDLENRLNGEFVVVDANNTFALMSEFASTIAAYTASAQKKNLERVYPTRATSFSDLWTHVSDYEYVGVFSTPAVTSISLTYSKEYFLENAKDYNEYYGKVVIPANTEIKIDGHMFGLYYPIELRINKSTGKFISIWDTTVKNPLMALSSNIVESYETKFDGISTITLIIPIYQFKKNTVIETIPPNLGFYRTYKIENRFYSIRVYDVNKDNEIISELKTTFSDSIYDPLTPTAKILISQDENKVTVDIPYVYIENKKIGNKIMLEIYSTEGDILLNFGNLDNRAIAISYELTKYPNKYSDILSAGPVNILQLTTGIVEGGTSSKTFEEVRDMVINKSTHQDVLINDIDIQSYFGQQQYRIKKYKDNITDRVYFAYKELKDEESSIVPSTVTNILIRNDTYKNVSTVIRQLTDTFTILPSTLYKYNEYEQYCYPVEDNELTSVFLKSKDEIVEYFNKDIYTRSPFHILFMPKEKYPEAIAFNLWKPYITSSWFKASNDTILQANVLASVVGHLDDGQGGYEVRVQVTKMGGMELLEEEDILFLCTTKSRDGGLLHTELKFEEITESKDFIYSFKIESTYSLTEDSHIGVTVPSSGDNIEKFISLTPTFNIVAMVKKQLLPNATNKNIIVENVPRIYLDKYLGISSHELGCHLGHSLSTVLNTNVDIRWDQREYLKWDHDVPALYKKAEYETTIVGGKIVASMTHTKGEQIYDDEGSAVYLAREGDVVLDNNSLPTLLKDRDIHFMISAIHIDYRIFMSEQQVQLNFVDNLSDTLENIFEFLRTSKKSLGELMQLYFRPTKTFGYGQFNLGNGSTITLPLNMKMSFKFYVPRHVLINEILKNVIISSSTKLVEEYISKNDINMAEITNLLRNHMSDYIKHIDVLGINNSESLQTLMRLDSEVQPSLSQELYLSKDGQYSIKKGLDIEFINKDLV